MLGLSAHNPYGSPQSTNPFEKAESNVKNMKDKSKKKDNSADRRTRQQRSKEKKDRSGNKKNDAQDLLNSVKSQSLFSNYSSAIGGQKKDQQLLGERALTEFGSNFDLRRQSSAVSEISMNTQQNCVALEQQLQKYEADIRKHISIEH